MVMPCAAEPSNEDGTGWMINRPTSIVSGGAAHAGRVKGPSGPMQGHAPRQCPRAGGPFGASTATGFASRPRNLSTARAAAASPTSVPSGIAPGEARPAVYPIGRAAASRPPGHEPLLAQPMVILAWLAPDDLSQEHWYVSMNPSVEPAASQFAV
jgi:hypothetical protein